MKQNKNLKNKDIKRIAYSVFAIGTSFMLVVLFIALRQAPFTLQELNYLLPQIFYYVMICLVMVVLFAFIAFMMFKFIDSKTVKTTIHLISNKINIRILSKNNRSIQPYLLSFLYETLERNNDFLKLPLGKDYSALIPNGFNFVCRQGCVFQIFQLVVPEKLDVEDNILKKLTKSYIYSELLNYGIAGLNNFYNSRIYGKIPTVFIDRVYYNESQHMLNFEVLYVCTENDTNYVIKAEKRDNKSPEIERTVYDDEL